MAQAGTLPFGVILVIEKTFLLKLLEKLPRFVSHIYSIILILLGWVIFAFDSLSSGFAYFKAMIGINSNGFIDGIAIYNLRSYAVMFIIGIIASLPLCKKLFDKHSGRARYVLMGILSIISIAVCTIYLVSSAYNPFLYFRF